MTTDLEKRLLMCMQLGIRIICENGHRYIEVESDTQAEELNLSALDLGIPNLYIDRKIYGPLSEALNHIDACLILLKKKTLLEQFNERDLANASYGYGLDEAEKVSVSECISRIKRSL